MRQILHLLGVLAIATFATYAQPARPAEVQKLDAFIGEWRMQDDPPDSPNRTICQWAPNGRCLLCDQIHPGADGPVRELNIFTYDRAASAYVMHGLHPQRRAPFSIEGRTWTFGGDRNRVVNVWESPSVMHYFVQSSDGGDAWATNADGRLVRTRETPVAPASASATASLLDPLVGTWQLRGGRNATSTCAWSPNHAFLVCDQLAADADTLVVYSTTEPTKFLVQSVSVDGGSLRAFDGTIANGVWTYTAMPADGQERTRVTRTPTSATAVRAREEVSADGTTWTLRAEWTETKGS